MNENQKKIYIENFNIIVSAYAHGIKVYPGEIYDELVHIFIKDLKPMLVEAVKLNYVFSILEIAEKLCEASLFRLNPEAIVSNLLDLLPHPSELTLNQQDTLIQIIESVDYSIPGTLDRIRWDWRQAAA